MPTPDWRALHEDLEALHAVALAAADPATAVTRNLSLSRDGLVVGERPVQLSAAGRVFLVAVGKASLRMASAAAAVLGDRLDAGLVIHPHGWPAHAGPWPRALRRLAAGHPLPDAASLAAGEAVAGFVAGTRADDLVLVLLSGGASALVERLRPGLDLDDLRAVTAALQRAGVDVVALNTVRRALSTLKGGGLARLASPAPVVTLALSDVVGDAPSAIGSGPTVPSPTGAADAFAVLGRAGVADALPRIVAALRAAAEGADDASTPAGRFVIVGSNRIAAEAVAATAAARGFHATVVNTTLTGEAREAGSEIARQALVVRASGLPYPPPACLVFGGETTVTVRGTGHGGRNQELALGALRVLAGSGRTALLAFATDGIDGPTDGAGAVVTGETLARAEALGLDADAALEANDSGTFFTALGDRWVSGPTGTNVNDLAVVLVYP